MLEQITEFLDMKQAEGRARTTIHEYHLYLTAFAKHCNKSLDQVTNADVVSWIAQERAKGLADASVLARWRAVKVFFRWCVYHDHLVKSPLKMKAPKVKKKEPRVANYDTVQQLLAHPCDRWFEYRNRALIHLLFDTGMRIGEALSLQIEHIDFTDHLVHIPPGKDGESRIVPFTSACAASLQDWLAVKPASRFDQWLFIGGKGRGIAGPLTSDGVAGALRRWYQKVGVPYFNPHSLRHLFATRILNRGMRVEVVSKLLGHYNVDITLRHYARLQTQVIRQEYKEYWGE